MTVHSKPDGRDSLPRSSQIRGKGCLFAQFLNQQLLNITLGAPGDHVSYSPVGRSVEWGSAEVSRNEWDEDDTKKRFLESWCSIPNSAALSNSCLHHYGRHLLYFLFAYTSWRFCYMQLNKTMIKTMEKLCKLIMFLIFESSCWKEFSNADKKCTRKVLIHIYLKINGTFYYHESSESLYGIHFA